MIKGHIFNELSFLPHLNVPGHNQRNRIADFDAIHGKLELNTSAEIAKSPVHTFAAVFS